MVVTLAGALLRWRSRAVPTRLPGRAFAGLLLIGWGAFNVVGGAALARAERSGVQQRLPRETWSTLPTYTVG